MRNRRRQTEASTGECEDQWIEFHASREVEVGDRVGDSSADPAIPL